MAVDVTRQLTDWDCLACWAETLEASELDSRPEMVAKEPLFRSPAHACQWPGNRAGEGR